MRAGGARERRTVRRIRLASAFVAVASLVGLVMMATGAPQARAAGGSAMTVSWLDDDSPAKAEQPARPADDGSGKLSDFQNLKITVSQTSDLIDQAVTITASGMAPTLNLGHPGAASNYLQIMQCWGDPSSPAFRQNCVFGAWGNTGFDTGVAGKKLGDAGAGPGTIIRPDSVPFDAVSGGHSTVNGSLDGLERFFNTSTGNEQDFVPIYKNRAGDNTTSTEFNVQSSATAPWLGCGQVGSATGLKCSLVIVPRGTHSGVYPGKPSDSCTENETITDGGYGSQTAVQVGSPLSTACSFWDDRIVIPLSFLPVGSKCPEDAEELPTNGSMLMNAAMSSWQGAVCAAPGGSVVNLINTAGSLTRQQLLSGTTKLAFIGQPVTAADDPGGQYLDSADIRYAPVANAALSIGFLVEQASRPESINLTPRLVAKLLTQSYRMQVPTDSSDYPVSYLPDNPKCIVDDPEFQAINQDEWQQGALSPLCSTPSSGLIVSGPAGDDAIQLLWQWIESDTRARTWLTGKPDENRMVINPYYLPSSNRNALKKGLGGTDLAQGPVSQFFRADQTALDSDVEGLTLDSIAWNPFSNDFGGVATRVLNGDSQQATGTTADRTFDPPQLPKAAPEIAGSGKGLMGVTDQADVDQYGLDAAALQLPNSPDPTDLNSFVSPTADSMAAAVRAEKLPPSKRPATGMATVDFSKLPPNAYPLTTTVYAAVNITDSTLDTATRKQYAGLLDYATGDGQVPGTQRGELPEGYAPLSVPQVIQAEELVGILNGTVAPNGPSAPTPAPTVTVTAAPSPAPTMTVVAASGSSGETPQNPTTDAYSPSTGNVPAGGRDVVNTVSASDASGGAADDSSPVAAQKQPASKSMAGQAALGGSLGAGVAGMIAAPFLMRRKAITP
ncbi:MAG TPA: hypothetical protein VGC45_09305 [Gryllotalpicola sp.]